MLEQIKVLNSAESYVCTLSNALPASCPIIEFRQAQEALSGGAMTDTCRLVIPATHADAQYVVKNNYLLFHDTDGFWQEYKIVDTQNITAVAGSQIIATGEHAFYELAGEPLNDIRPTDTTATLAVIQALQDTRWTIGTGADLGNNSARIYKTSVLAGLAQIAERWGGELRYWVQVIGNAIVSRRVDILARRGADTGKRFEYKKDLAGVTYTENVQNLATALIGRGKGVEVSGGTKTEDPAYGRRLEFTDVVWSVGEGDPADKPAGQNWIGDDVAAAAYGPGGRHIFGFVTFDECTDAEELLALTYAELQARKVPRSTYEMTVVVLEGISGYEHEAVRLGDTVGVINTAVTPKITGQARVIKIDKSLINPIDAHVTIGNFIPTISCETRDMQYQQQAMLDRAGVWDNSTAIQKTTGEGGIEYIIDLLKTQLASTTSGVSTDANGNIIIESADGTAALKLGGGILALANTKTAGEYDWRTFATGAGVVADEIISGTLRSAIVFAGTLLGASGTFADLVAGIIGAQRMHMGYDENNDPFFRMYDNTNTLRITIYKSGILFGSTVKLVECSYGNYSGVGFFIS